MITVGSVVKVPDNVRAALQEVISENDPEAAGEYRVISLDQRLGGGREATVYLPRLKTLRVYRVFYVDSRTALTDCVAVPLLSYTFDSPPGTFAGYVESGQYDTGSIATDLRAFADAEGQAGWPLDMVYLQPTPVGAQALIVIRKDGGGHVYVVGMAQVLRGYRCSSLAHALIEADPEDVAESLRRSWQDATSGRVKPVETLWDDIGQGEDLTG